MRLRALTLRAMLRFLKMYVLRRGFLGGSYAAVRGVLASSSVFMTYAMLWNVQRLARGAGSEST